VRGLNWRDGWVRDNRGREVSEEMCSGETGTRISESGSDFVEGHEDEGALCETGMGNFKAGLREDEIAVEENVEVEGAGAVGDAVQAVAAKSALDFEEVFEEGQGIEGCFESGCAVEEGGLVGVSDGFRGVPGGFGDECSKFGEAKNGSVKGFARRAGGAGKVGAEGDVGGLHGG